MSSATAALPPIERLRTLHGRGTSAWATDLEIGESHWLALSGAMHPDYNLALCHGPAGGQQVQHCIDTLTARRRPAILSLAGEAQQDTSALTCASWRQVGSAPFMVRRLQRAAVPDGTRRLRPDEVGLARELVAHTFDLTPDITAVAVRDDLDSAQALWGAFDPATDELASCAIAVHVEEAVVIWSMATAPHRRRAGHGTRVLDAALAGAAERGCQVAVLHASSAGEPFYLSRGFDMLERWAFWSRPRWVLAD